MDPRGDRDDSSPTTLAARAEVLIQDNAPSGYSEGKDIAKDRACVDRRELVGVTEEHQARIVAGRPKQAVH